MRISAFFYFIGNFISYKAKTLRGTQGGGKVVSRKRHRRRRSISPSEMLFYLASKKTVCRHFVYAKLREMGNVIFWNVCDVFSDWSEGKI